MIISDNLLFNQKRLSDALSGQLALVIAEVDIISKEQFSANTDDQIVEYVFSKMEITPLKIYRDQMSVTEPQETTVERRNQIFERMVKIPVINLELIVPYTGESDLWKMQPSTSTLNPPRGDYSPQRGNDQAGTFRFKMEFSQGEFTEKAVNQEIERGLNAVEAYLEYIQREIENFSPQLREEICRRVLQRRERLGIIQNVTHALNIPIQKRNGIPDLNSIPLQRKKVQSLATQANRPHEYSITNDHFEYILKVIRHEGRSYERTPQPFSKHNEEELRDILMSHLNGHYNGLANGEAFRKNGKTDICIEFESRAAFVAECKLWKGEQKLQQAIDQLLGYLTWRDSKTALVIFNKEVAGFKEIQDKLPAILRSHPKFVRMESIPESGEWRAVYKSAEDDLRLVTVHVFIFNLFISQ